MGGLARNRLVVLAVAGVVLGVVAALGLLALPWLPEQASVEGGRVDDIFWGLTLISGAIAGIVYLPLAYSILRFRRRDENDMREGRPLHGHTGLEIFWTAVPFLIVASLGTWAGIVLHDDEAHAADTRVVQAIGQRYGWSYVYKSDGGMQTGQLVLPVGQKVIIETVSIDVIHDFFVPEWRTKMDAVPGNQGSNAREYVTPTKTGQYHPECAELCGPGHAQMTLTAAPVKVVPAAQFTSYIQGLKKQSQGQQPGAKVYAAQGCGGCHTYKPANSQGKVGPDLDNVAQDAKAAGKTVTQYVRESIVQPNVYIAKDCPTGPCQGNIMPGDYGNKIKNKDLQDLIDFVSGGKP